MDNPIPTGRAARKATLASRLRRFRLERYGEHGGPELARALGVPFRTWANYEAGITIPGEVLLAFLAATGAEPAWLLDWKGPAYRAPRPSGDRPG